MARRLMWKTAAAGAAAMTGILAAGLAPVQAATRPHWQITKKVGASSAMTIPEGLVATGRRDAWSLWQTCSAGCDRAGTARLEHWNGTKWSRRSSAALRSLRVPVAVGASSSSDVWVFGGQYGSRDKSTTDLHWNGHAWRKITAPWWVISRDDGGDQPASALVFGSRDVWVFSLIEAGGGRDPELAGRYNGHRWVKVHLPGTPFGVSAVSRTDIWAIGASVKTSRYELMHWNGKRWSTRRIPASPSGKIIRPGSLTAAGPRSAWMLAADGGASPDTGYLLHWNGTTWRWIKAPTANLTGLAPDGLGGWWTTSNPPTEASAEGIFRHYRNGHWKSYPVPPAQSGPFREFWGLTRVPGTTSVMATSQLNIDGYAVGAIWQYRG